MLILRTRPLAGTPQITETDTGLVSCVHVRICFCCSCCAVLLKNNHLIRGGRFCVAALVEHNTESACVDAKLFYAVLASH